MSREHHRPLGLSTFDPTDKARVLVVGDSGVGKTSLVHLLCRGEPLRSPVGTVGCSVDVKVHEHPRTKRSYFVEFLDVAGSSKQKLSRSIFYSNINALILVHDSTNKKSYQNLWKWTAEVFNSPQFKGVFAPVGGREQVAAGAAGHGRHTVDFDIDVRVGDAHPTIPILVVGTKADLVSDVGRRRTSIAEEYGGDCISMTTQQQLTYSPSLERIDGFLSAVIEAKMTGVSPTSGSSGNNNLTSASGISSAHSATNIAGLPGGLLLPTHYGGGPPPHTGSTGIPTSMPTSTNLTPEMQRRRIPQSGLYGAGAGGRPGSPSKSFGSATEAWKRSSSEIGPKGPRGYR
ncbi:P-loop containing nucleoside triphosphate hydrolase protein [Powellomyces hirtus]|nr:P-loop containing nucleoside triphosphate hydrolase protein [Powellomyces hirtus]